MKAVHVWPWVALAGLLAWLEWGLAHMPNSFTLKQQAAQQQGDSTRLLVLGNSHGLKGLDPALLPGPGLNWANVSQTPFYDSALLAQAQQRMPGLRTVVLQLAWFSLGQQLWDTEAFRCYFYHRYWGVGYPGMQRLSFAATTHLGLYGPWQGLLLGLQGFPHQAADFSPLGWQPVPAALVEQAAAQLRAASHLHSYRPHHVPGNLRRLQASIARCQAAGQQVLVLQLPVHPHYAAAVPQRHWLAMQQLFAQLQKEHPGLQTLNLHQHPALQADSLWADADHLSAAGAQVASRVVARYLAKDTAKHEK